MKKLFLSALIFFFLLGCKKDIYKPMLLTNSSDKSTKQATGSLLLNKLDYFKLLTHEFLTSAKNSQDFKKWIYESCYAQDSGDYYVPVYDLLDKNERLGYCYWDVNKANYIREEIVDKIKEIDVLNDEIYGSPIVFVTSLEDINIDSLSMNIPITNPIACIGLEYDSITTYCPGYSIDFKDSLICVSTTIDENYAWSHDVWVFGQEEPGVENGIVNLGNNLNFFLSRVDGAAEYGGIVKVSNISKLESWVGGKLEFSFYVYGGAGTQLSYVKFPRIKRKHFKDQNWYDYNSFLFYWNRANIGDWQIEGWIERDGGKSSAISVSIPPPPNYPGPSITLSIPAEDRDDDCGRKIVQFSDPITTIYPISYMSFKRKSL